jgi:hypothetical protein
MDSFIICFSTDAQWAELAIDAATPAQALKHARRIATDRLLSLEYEAYDGVQPIKQIEVLDDDGNRLALWQDDELRLRLAGPDLLAAAKKVVDRWEHGDLADAVRELDAAIAKAKDGTA